jgi:hypothetical protein
LAQSWGIGLETAKQTLKVTTQKGMRNTLYPIERCFRTKQAQLRYKQLSGRHGRFYTDTFFANTVTLNGSKMAQLYINDLSFTKVYPMKLKSEAADTLSTFYMRTYWFCIVLLLALVLILLLAAKRRARHDLQLPCLQRGRAAH